MTPRLLTDFFVSKFSFFPIGSQQERGMEGICNAVFYAGSIKWYVMEADVDFDLEDAVLYCIVVGAGYDEAGYISIKDLSDVAIPCPGYFAKVKEVPNFTATPLKNICDSRLQNFLNKMYHEEHISDN